MVDHTTLSIQPESPRLWSTKYLDLALRLSGESPRTTRDHRRHSKLRAIMNGRLCESLTSINILLSRAGDVTSIARRLAPGDHNFLQSSLALRRSPPCPHACDLLPRTLLTRRVSASWARGRW